MKFTKKIGLAFAGVLSAVSGMQSMQQSTTQIQNVRIAEKQANKGAAQRNTSTPNSSRQILAPNAQDYKIKPSALPRYLSFVGVSPKEWGMYLHDSRKSNRYKKGKYVARHA